MMCICNTALYHCGIASFIQAECVCQHCTKCIGKDEGIAGTEKKPADSSDDCWLWFGFYSSTVHQAAETQL